jgi:hypothetical protein
MMDILGVSPNCYMYCEIKTCTSYNTNRDYDITILSYVTKNMY